MPKRISEEVRAQIAAEPATMSINAIAEKYGLGWSTARALRGLNPPSTSLAKRGEVVEIDPPAEETVTCEFPVKKLDAIYELLTPYQKAVAVLSGVGEVPAEE